jgi:hypothetical protein
MNGLEYPCSCDHQLLTRGERIIRGSFSFLSSGGWGNTPAVLARSHRGEKTLTLAMLVSPSPRQFNESGLAAVSFVVTKNRTNSHVRISEGGKNVMETQLDDSFRLANKQISPIEMLVTRDLTEL